MTITVSTTLDMEGDASKTLVITSDNGPIANFLITDQGAKGVVTYVEDSATQITITYTPDEEESGSDEFGFHIEDGDGADPQTIDVTNIDTLSENVAPVVEDYYFDANDGVDTDTSGTIAWEDIIDAVASDENYSDDNTNLIVNIIGSAPDGFTLTNDEVNRELNWSRDSGTDTDFSFSFNIEDDEGLTSETATFTIDQIGGDIANADPVGEDDTISIEGASTATLDVLANDTDTNLNDDLTITAKTDGSKGTVEIAEDGLSIIYTANEGETGSDVVTYTVSDGTATDTATVIITDIGAVSNVAPTAADDTLDLGNGLTGTVDVLDNDSDPDIEDTITILSYSQGEIGSVSMNEDGDLVYTVNDGEYGSDEFTYTITDGSGGSATATVAVSNISDVPETAPEAADDYISVEGDDGTAGIDIDFADLLANDTDANSDVLSVTFGFQPMYGNLVYDDVNSKFVYTSDATGTDEEGDPIYAEEDSFEYTISDGNGGTSSAMVYLSDINVETEHAPVGVDDTASVAGLDSVDIEVLANDTDADNEDDLEVQVYTQGEKGTVTDDGNGVLTYTPDEGETGEDSFVYQVIDGDGLVSTATVTITGIGDPATITDGVGTEANDIMEGATGADSMDGGAGDDVMSAAGGNDTVRGDEGNDDMRAGNGDDKVYGGDGDDLMRGGNGNDKVRGNLGDDRIYGNNGNDKLYGGAGEDSLIGGKDNDKMWGGDDADTFMFKGSDLDGMNRIHDFEVGSDKIQIGNGVEMGDLTMKDKDYGVKIMWGDGDAGVRLDDVMAADLSASDFLFS